MKEIMTTTGIAVEHLIEVVEPTMRILTVIDVAAREDPRQIPGSTNGLISDQMRGVLRINKDQGTLVPVEAADAGSVEAAVVVAAVVDTQGQPVGVQNPVGDINLGLGLDLGQKPDLALEVSPLRVGVKERLHHQGDVDRVPMVQAEAELQLMK